MITDYKVTNAEIASHGVESADDTLVGTAQENKAIFDQLAKWIVSNKYNELIDALLTNVCNVEWDNVNKDIVFTCCNGTNIRINIPSISTAGVTSFNGQQGDITYNGYQKPATGIPASDLANNIPIDTFTGAINGARITDLSITASKLTGNIGAGKLTGSIPYTTDAPTYDSVDGVRICILDSEPETKYNGWLYFIKE